MESTVEGLKFPTLTTTPGQAGFGLSLESGFVQSAILLLFCVLTVFFFVKNRSGSERSSSDKSKVPKEKEANSKMPPMKVPKSTSGCSKDFNGNIIKSTPTEWVPRVSPIDYDNQATVDASTGERLPRYYNDPLDKNFQLMKSLYPEEVKTMLDAMQRGFKRNPKGNCLGRIDQPNKTVNWQSYEQVWKRIQAFGNGLKATLQPDVLSQSDKQTAPLSVSKVACVGVYSINRPEYVVAEYGSYWQSFTVVPIYDTLGPNALSFIVNQAEMECIVCDKLERCQLILSQATILRSLKFLIVFDDIPESYKLKASTHGIQVLTIDQIEKIGLEHPLPSTLPDSETLAVICYTSGTTDMPKGVMLTHGNIVANVSAVMYQMMENTIRGEDVLMSYLPLAHMFERNCENALFMEGGGVAFYGGDIKLLSDDMKLVGPTLLPAVPRLLTRIFCKIQDSVKSSYFKSFLLKSACHFKLREMERSRVIRNDTLWDRFVFKKIRDTLGGRVRLILSGSAPLNPNVFEFLRCTLGCVVTEGYGQTECVAPCTLTFSTDVKLGHVGPPLSCAVIKLIDVPEMGYLASEGRGEVLVRGPIVFKGYFKDPERTKQALDDNGWLHTGDIGQWTENGTLRIIDRKKNIFKLSQGEYIAPEKIENIYAQCGIIAQIFVYGESLKSSLVAIVVPDQVIIEMWARNNGINGNYKELCLNKNVKQMIHKELIQVGKRDGLKSFEQVQEIYVHSELFSIENGMLTPTMKSKRNEIYKHFENEIKNLYSKLD